MLAELCLHSKKPTPIIMKTFLLLTLLALSQASFAAVLRVNNNPGVNAPYSSATTAISAAASGDTILLEGSATSYGTFSFSKRLTICGTGYFLNSSTPNPYTQAASYNAIADNIICNLGSKGSVVEGIEISTVLIVGDSAITIQRNNFGYTSGISLAPYSNAIAGDTIRNNFINRIYTNSSNRVKDLMLYNNILFGNGMSFNNSTSLALSNGYCFNNSFVANGGMTFACANFVFQNNIFNQPDFGTTLASNTFFYNISGNANIPSGNSNVLSASMSSTYLGWSSATGYSPDGRYQLASSSPGIGAGYLNGVAVDCGAFGGPAPYILSGMPPVPSVYQLTAPSQTASGATSMSISVSAASH